MEFGKLLNIDQVNWSVPEMSPVTKDFLKSQSAAASFNILFGTPAWGHKEWIGKIYPQKTKAADYLYYYSRKFSCIELNTSHYRIPSSEQTERWLLSVPENFIFCPKVYQTISHSTQGLVDQDLLKEWITFLQNLKQNRGPSFLQFPPHFDYSYKTLLFRFLQIWPSEYELALEFRHPSWFADGQILPALTEYLQKKKIGLVITDVAGRRDVVHTSISAKYAMVRFIGNELHKSDYARADAWAARFESWRQLGLQKIYLFIHEPDDVSAPEMTTYFTKKLNETCGTQIQFEVLPVEDQQPKLL